MCIAYKDVTRIGDVVEVIKNFKSSHGGEYTMGRPIYNYELSDPDFSWLISSFKENNPKHALVDSSGVPISFICAEKSVEIHEATEAPVEEFEGEVANSNKKENDNLGEAK